MSGSLEYNLLSCLRGWCRFLGSFPHHGYRLAIWVLRPLNSYLAFIALMFLLLCF